MSRFWSPIVDRLVPYTPGELPKTSDVIKLNTNEHPYGPSPQALKAIQEETDDRLRLYPDPGAVELKRAIGGSHRLNKDHVFVGNGSDEVLAHAFRAFFTGKDPILFPDITYSFYPTYCLLFGIECRQVPLTDRFEVDLADYQNQRGGIILANPNAPTGIALPLKNIEALLTQNPDCVVIIDEAYVDFGGESAASLIPDHDNLLVIQTFSKSRGLAGMRVGFALGQTHLIEALNRVKDSFNSYPLGRLSQAAALAAWDDKDWFETTRHEVMAGRDTLTAQLTGLGFTVLPSATNFVFVSHPKETAASLHAALKAVGILVRHFKQPRIENWLRITVGTSDQSERLVDALKRIL
ncbi:histidinol-phosphate transaminase [Labrenzia sp. PHM005]|uniref:histidinol-phosphate transaminase n=1 Tax=Labrenzia sp. PHM005 TaxID=2590016 RepID=UPI0011404BB8|nr:histidinol-phosphate transaminase [Labrenzia sp. PHM005]QDG77574.1 histidinol-phosphate transaminase [Labrenzia sp. PHM005]